MVVDQRGGVTRNVNKVAIERRLYDVEKYGAALKASVL
jgi:hypothetical protein